MDNGLWVIDMRLLNSMRQGNNPRVAVIVQGSVSKSQLQEPFASGVRCQRIASLQTVLLFLIPRPRSRFRLLSVQRTCCRLGLRLAERVEGLKGWSHLDQRESVGWSAHIPISEPVPAPVPHPQYRLQATDATQPGVAKDGRMKRGM